MEGLASVKTSLTDISFACLVQNQVHMLQLADMKLMLLLRSCYVLLVLEKILAIHYLFKYCFCQIFFFSLDSLYLSLSTAVLWTFLYPFIFVGVCPVH